jgi:hypothetical protein
VLSIGETISPRYQQAVTAEDGHGRTRDTLPFHLLPDERIDGIDNRARLCCRLADGQQSK